MKSFLLLLFFIPLIPSILAQTDTSFEIPDNVGITPDNPLYFLDVVIDQIRLNIASTDSEKARIGMEIAEERLMEVKAMINQNRINDADKAQIEHDNAMKDIIKRLASNEDDDTLDNTEKELESTIEIEKRIESHKLKIEEVKDKVKMRLMLNRDRLSENENANLERVTSGLENAITRVDIKIDDEKTRLKIKFSEEFAVQSSDFNKRVSELEDNFDMEIKSDNSGSDRSNSGSSNSGSSNSGSGSSNSGKSGSG